MKKSLDDLSHKPIKIIGVSSSKRAKGDCAREDPISLELLKISLEEAKKAGAEVELIDLRDLIIGPCKECYSTCPAQCRFNEDINQCDCYAFKKDTIVTDKEEVLPLELAYDIFKKHEFFRLYNSHGNFVKKDEMYKIYKALREADGVIFSTYTSFYSRPALLQIMLSRLCALDGGVEELWGDGKNLKNSIKYAKNKNAEYNQRLYGKHCAFINVSKEGDSVSPDLMKACSMMGMKIIPLGVAYRVNWYYDPCFVMDKVNSLKDNYSISSAREIGRKIVEEVSKGNRIYGKYSKLV